MKLKAALLLCFALLAVPAAHAAQADGEKALTPEFLRESCYNSGAVNTVRALTAEGSTMWAELMEHIASGDSNWIIHVPLFASGTDAGSATQLTIALAKALPKNPQAVLSLEYSFVSLRNVCSLPFINPDEDFIRQYSQEVLRSMREVSDPYMQMDKDICLIRLRHAVDVTTKRINAARQQ